MGGGNAQKSAAARERNQKKVGKTDEERKAASAKAAKDSSAFMCTLCRTTFMVNVKPPTLLLHVTAKHPTCTDPTECFSSLAGFDPNAPKTAPVAAASEPVKPKKKKVVAGLDDLLDAGLSKSKK
jgi:hypothetical protein